MMGSGDSKTKRVLILLSGGIDSTTCIQYYKQKNYVVQALFVNYGQEHFNQEMNAAIAVSKYYHVPLEILEINSMKIPNGYIPGRNLMLLSIGLMKCQFGNGLICIGIHSGTEYNDCTPKFENLMQNIFNLYEEGRIQLDTPFLNWSKSELIDYAKQIDLPFHLTFSSNQVDLPQELRKTNN